MTAMGPTIQQILERGGVADITTIGRKTGLPRRIEIDFHHSDTGFFLTGRPGVKRDWLANLIANPQFTLHLKRGVSADLAAIAKPIDDPAERAAVLYRLLTDSWGVDPDKARRDLSAWVDSAPLVRFKVEG